MIFYASYEKYIKVQRLKGVMAQGRMLIGRSFPGAWKVILKHGSCSTILKGYVQHSYQVT